VRNSRRSRLTSGTRMPIALPRTATDGCGITFRRTTIDDLVALITDGDANPHLMRRRIALSQS